MWQHLLQVNIDAQLGTMTDPIYYNHNIKLDVLQKQEHYNYNSKTTTKYVPNMISKFDEHTVQ
jgi:hypothetical protein